MQSQISRDIRGFLECRETFAEIVSYLADAANDGLDLAASEADSVAKRDVLIAVM